MLNFIGSIVAWLIEFALSFVPGWVRTWVSDLTISVLQPLAMPLVHANMFPDFLTRLAIRVQLQ